MPIKKSCNVLAKNLRRNESCSCVGNKKKDILTTGSKDDMSHW